MKTKVILAESRPLVQRAILSVLEEASDVDVIASVTDKETLLKQVREQKPNVVITNAQMWIPHPTRAVEELKRACPDTEMLVLVGRDRATLATAFMDAKVLGCLFDTDKELLDLKDAIERIALGRKAYSPEAKDQYFHLPRLDLSPLSERSRKALLLAAYGFSNQEIASRLKIKTKAVANALSAAYRHLDLKADGDINKRTRAAIMVWRMGLVEDKLLPK